MKKRIISALLSLAFAVGAAFATAVPTFAADSEDTVVVFTSDVHHNSVNDDASANRLKIFLEHVTTAYGQVDALGVCGDLGIPGSDEEKYWSYTQRVMDNVASTGIEGIYTTGNHEHKNGNFSTTTNDTAKSYIRLGLGKKAENYEIYCFGAASKEMEFPESDIKTLSDYLKTVGTEKPVFILSHYPLHPFTYREGGKYVTRDPVNREKVVELLNQYPNAFFIWGHNHSKNDPNYDKIQTKSVAGESINFTYAAGGSMTERSDGNIYSGNITGKGLVALISKDGKRVSLRYLDEDHSPLAEWSSEADLAVTVTFDQNSESSTLHMILRKSCQTAIHFAAVAFDANGRMIGLAETEETVDDDTTKLSLHFASSVRKSDAAALRVIAIDTKHFCPLCQAAQ